MVTCLLRAYGLLKIPIGFFSRSQLLISGLRHCCMIAFGKQFPYPSVLLSSFSCKLHLLIASANPLILLQTMSEWKKHVRSTTVTHSSTKYTPHTQSHTQRKHCTHTWRVVSFQMKELPRYSSEGDSVLFKYKQRLNELLKAGLFIDLL